MGLNIKCLALVIGLALGAVAIGLIASAIGQGGLTPPTVYLTGIGVLIMSVGFLAAVPLYQRINDLEDGLGVHKRHDRKALKEAAGLDDGDEDTGGQQIPRIGR